MFTWALKTVLARFGLVSSCHVIDKRKIVGNWKEEEVWKLVELWGDNVIQGQLERCKQNQHNLYMKELQWE